MPLVWFERGVFPRQLAANRTWLLFTSIRCLSVSTGARLTTSVFKASNARTLICVLGEIRSAKGPVGLAVLLADLTIDSCSDLLVARFTRWLSIP